jgi:mono/diheme cytochrome c family protein
MPRLCLLLLCLSIFLVLLGCDDRSNMVNAARTKPYEPVAFYKDAPSARPLVAGVVARGHLDEDEGFFTGKVGGQPLAVSPVATTAALLRRGQERFNIYCAVCHGRDGYGEGVVVRRGYSKAASYHDPKLLAAPDGHFFDVMTNGFGQMPSYAFLVTPEDRWAIVAYIRALQLSQHARPGDWPESERAAAERNP